MDWGALQHGGCRKKQTSAVVEPSRGTDTKESVGDKALPMGDVRHSAVGEPAAMDEELTEELVAIPDSAVGENHQHNPPEALPPTLEPYHSPKQLGPYSIIEFLNHGSFGDVYKAVRKSSGDTFAVKVMRKARRTARLKSEQCRELSFMKELKNKHPHIISLQGWRETPFDIQLFMPKYDMNLREYLKQQRFRVPRCQGAPIVSQILGAVTFLQDEHILHRDIKPANVLIQSQPLAAVLADFGDARRVVVWDPERYQGVPLTPGRVTLWYRAPEILSGKPYGLPSDIWSLGITFAELASGHAPFRQSSEISMLDEISREMSDEISTKDFGARYGMAYEEMVCAMLAVDPGSRISCKACEYYMPDIVTL